MSLLRGVPEAVGSLGLLWVRVTRVGPSPVNTCEGPIEADHTTSSASSTVTATTAATAVTDARRAVMTANLPVSCPGIDHRQVTDEGPDDGVRERARSPPSRGPAG